jgi:hypothetical protein
MNVSQQMQDISNTPTRVVVFLFVSLALIALMAVSFSQNKEKINPSTSPTPSQEIVNLSPHTLIYGAWTNTHANIHAYDLTTGKEGVIARLPATIKKITVLSPESILYINNTSTQDYGTELVKYNLISKEATTVYRAQSDFGIDDYVISPNLQSIAVWEVQPSKDSKTLLNGKSAVYTANLSSPDKHKIVEEIATQNNPVRYPRAITDRGTVFMDRLLPNNGAGWSYGMETANFEGTERKPITSMASGTYGTQPILSPDGRYLVFVGNEGSANNGASVSNGFRRALTSLNTVELLDTQTLERTQLSLPTQTTYVSAKWGRDANTLVILGIQNNQVKHYIYDIEAKRSEPMTISLQSEDIIQQLTSDIWLVGTQNSNESMIGNLGEEYAAPFTRFSVYHTKEATTTPLNTNLSLMQVITVLESTSFGSFETVLKNSPEDEEKLQLNTFSFKPELASIREKQKSKILESARDNASSEPLSCDDVKIIICGVSRASGDGAHVCQRNIVAPCL